MSSGTSSGSSLGTRGSRSSSENAVNLQAQMENRRKRRKESNKESARRSRLRKQQHLDDLNSQVNQLKDQKKQLGAALRLTSQNLVAVQAQNSVLQTQKMELESGLGSLTEILLYLNAGASTSIGPAMNAGILNNGGLAPTGGACDVLGAGAWNQPAADLYYQCF